MTNGESNTEKKRGKNPKTARVVSIPEDRPLTFSEMEDLRDHAYNSAFWNVTNYRRTEKQVRDKLISKGYPDDEVSFLNENGEINKINFIEYSMSELMERELLGDVDYTERFISSKLGMGWGMSRIRIELMKKGVNLDLVDEVKENGDFDGEAESALDRQVRKTLASSSIARENDPFKRRQKAVQSLMRKGFSYGDISEKIREIEEEG